MFKVAIIFLFLSVSLKVNGQYLVGVKAGISSSKFRNFIDDSYFNSMKQIAGLEIGLVGSVEKKHFIFRHELNLIQKGGALSSHNKDHKTRVTQLEITPLVGGRAGFGKYSIYGITGLFFGYNIFGNTISNGTREKITFRLNSDGENSAKRLDLGYSFGIGVGMKTKVGVFAIDFRTRRSIFYLAEGEAEDFILAFKNSSWSVGATYLMNSKKLFHKQGKN